MEESLYCPYCGTERNSMDDAKCPECHRIYPDKVERIDGMPISDVTVFVEKNIEHYIPAFKKNAGKKRFIGWNWSAALFPTYWLFYRKMFRIGALFLVAINVISLLLSIILAFCFSPTHIAKAEAKTNYTYWEQKVNEYRRNDPAHANYENPEYAEISDKMWDEMHKYEEAEAKLRTVDLVQSIVLYLGSFLIMGLYGDSIYFDYVKRHVSSPSKGGTSFSEMMGAIIISNIITFLVGLLLPMLVAVWILV
ncbi:MAG: DUF2628 domain-containing protein [Clostridia bacterium]|nr:DUF2628 domain-containing protein [Clostridia bacterium]